METPHLGQAIDRRYELMATSARLKLFSTFRVWLTINTLVLTFLLVSGMGVARVSRLETQKLIDSQRETLTRARANDLEIGAYRSFVEGIGSEFKELFVSIRENSDRKSVNSFKVGPLHSSQMCSSGIFTPKSTGNSLHVQMCRPYSSPWLMFGYLVAAFLLISAISLKLVSRHEHSTLKTLLEFIRSSGVEVKSSAGLFGVLSRLKEIMTELELSRQRELEQAKNAAKEDLALRVAHDIRAPLDFLDTIFDKMEFPSEIMKRSILNATLRLKNVANDVLNEARGSNFNSDQNKESTDVAVSNSIEELIQEKKSKFEHRPGVQILDAFDRDQAFFVNCPSAELKRILSNLIENSAESISETGAIKITLRSSDNNVEISIVDTGVGIPEEVIPKLMTKGFSFGKKNGNGLGLYHSRALIERYGGTFVIDSRLGNGTKVTIRLPRVMKGDSNVGNSIALENVQAKPLFDIVLIDDDPFVHEMWDVDASRFKKNVLLLKSESELDAYNINVHTPICVDKNLGKGLSGLDVLRRLHERGFQSLYLCTAETAGHLATVPFVKAQIDKKFPIL